MPRRRAAHARHAKSLPIIRRSQVIYLNHVDTVEMYVTILSGLKFHIKINKLLISGATRLY
ncbi:hypothetical protein P5G64_16145 [Serratia nevei]|uniref:hypothetical protein n=1 Tax=Serratia marcescens TaxID=615 RepID=UPI001A3571B3|nr:hypothetical protein [Serratia marcescens]MDF8323578.1 hypothetical protein [Serratia nevei]MDF8338963.1 hypothetical protein [Serratia nevei]MDF8343436.1 hypothetical protein [Serratia nevei]MDF8349987.1 hypothetical protein [Serratia nevei]MDP8642102.1 hypothetical protein [Serratia marcescens]